MTLKSYRIAIVIPKYGLVGGAEQFVAEMTERIARNPQFDIHVFANRWVTLSDNVTFHKIPVITFPRFLTTISFAYFTGRKIRAMGFDLIHTHDRIFEADIFTMHGIPHRIWVHDIRRKSMSLFDHTTAWVEKKLIESTRCAELYAVSDVARDVFFREYTLPPARVRVMHPGVDLDRFTTIDPIACRREIRTRFGIGPSDTVLLFVSMNYEIKGLDHIMAGIAHARQHLQSAPVKLLIVGKGNVGKYSKIARTLGISDDVIFVGVQEEHLERFYHASDMFAILSAFDTFGITVLEAMSASLPVIVSSNVGAKDLVQHGINGFIIDDTKNIADIADKFVRLLDRNRRTAMGHAAYLTARDHTWERIAAGMEEVYRELLVRKSSA